MSTAGVLAAAAGALVTLAFLWRSMRAKRRIDVDPVSDQWLGEQKRQSEG